MVNPPRYLYKVVTVEDWEQSQRQATVPLSPIDRDFIHLATEEQLNRIINKYWSNQQFVILKLDSTKLIGRLVFETNPGGQDRYYHLYQGTIPINAVIGFSLDSNF